MIRIGAFKLSVNQGYFRANQVLLVLVLLAFLYPVLTELFNVENMCQYKIIYGRNCRSCGLTRGLRECYSGNFHSAQLLNNQSVFIFSIFIFQFIYRLGIHFWNYWTKFSDKFVKVLISIDIIILVLLFIANKFIYG